MVTEQRVHRGGFLSRDASAETYLLAASSAPGAGAVWRTFVTQSAGFKFVCAYIFFEYFRPQSLWPALEVVPLSMLVIFIGLAATVPEASRSGWTRSPANLWLAVYTLIGAISLVLAEFPNYGLSKWDYFIPWLLVYVLITNSVTSRNRFLLILLVYVLCNLKLSQFGLREWIMGGFNFAGYGFSGPRGWFQNSGELGVQMAMFTPLALLIAVGLWSRYGRLGKLVLVLVPLSAFVTTIGTHSRGAIIALAIAGVWALLACGIRVRSLLALGIIMFLASMLIGESTWQRFDEMGHDDTSIRRLTFFADGIEIIKANPWFGIGYFNWIPHYKTYFPPIADAGINYLGDYQLPHNILIQVTSELGIAGLSAFLGLVGLTFVINRKTRLLLGSNDPPLRLVAHGLDASLVAFLVAGQFVTVLYYPYFWINLAMTVALHEACRRDTAGWARRRPADVGRRRVRNGSGRAGAQSGNL